MPKWCGDDILINPLERSPCAWRPGDPMLRAASVARWQCSCLSGWSSALMR